MIVDPLFPASGKLSVCDAADAFVEITTDDVILDWNKHAETLFGWKAKDALGRTLGALIVTPTHRHAWHKCLQQCVASRARPLVRKRLNLATLHKDGREILVEVTITLVHLHNRIFFTVSIRDILPQRAAEQKLRECNALLCSIAGRLKAAVREGDTVARLGGDEFVVLLENIQDYEQIARVADNLLKVVSQPIELAGHVLTVSTSIGASIFPTDGHDAVTLFKNADLAMYAAKASGFSISRTSSTMNCWPMMRRPHSRHCAWSNAKSAAPTVVSISCACCLTVPPRTRSMARC